MRIPILILLTAGTISGAQAEGFPEETPCGLSGSNAVEFIEQITTAPGFYKVPMSARFDVFATKDQVIQWTVTLPGEAAYPAATCRHTYRAANGDWVMDRYMACDGPKDACDRLFREFSQLDADMRAAISRAKAP